MNVLFVLLGLTATSFMIEYFCISPGGLIVPVFLSAYIFKPQAIIGTFVVASSSFFILRQLNHYFLIQKNKRLVLTIVISTLFVFLWRKYLPFYFPHNTLFETVGWIIPGILSYTMQRNGFQRTVSFTFFTTLCLFPFYIISNIIAA